MDMSLVIPLFALSGLVCAASAVIATHASAGQRTASAARVAPTRGAQRH